jgi:hypothetical protein
MREQFDNVVMANMLLWMDNYVLSRGTAYTNYASNFYQISTRFNGYFTYGLPFGQIVYDQSITGARVPTGVYLDGSFLVTGQSGFAGINYDRGQAYFTGQITGANRISGNYSVKDFEIRLTSEPEETVLFETKYSLRPRVPQTATGFNSDEVGYPVIFLKKNGRYSTPFAFGGMDNTKITVSAYIFADSQFKLDAIESLIGDACYQYVPLLSVSEMPFNALGSLKSGVFNYNSAVSGKIESDNAVFISRVTVTKFERNLYSQMKSMNPGVYFGIVDMEVEKPRYPRT